MGYPPNKKGWKCLDLETNEIFISCDVVFQQEDSPFSSFSIKKYREPVIPLLI